MLFIAFFAILCIFIHINLLLHFAGTMGMYYGFETRLLTPLI